MIKPLNLSLLKIMLLIFAMVTWLQGMAQLIPPIKAPEFELEELLPTQGNDLPYPKSLRGQVIILDFWATWCKPCLAAFPKNNKIYQQFESEGLVFLAITDEKQERLSRFMEKSKVNFF